MTDTEHNDLTKKQSATPKPDENNTNDYYEDHETFNEDAYLRESERRRFAQSDHEYLYDLCHSESEAPENITNESANQ